MDALTASEQEILVMLASCLDSQTIAERLCLSEKTVRNHIANILRKLELHSRAQLVVYAWRTGLVSRDEEDQAPKHG